MLRRRQQQRAQMEKLVEELAAGGIETKADLATFSSLLDQNKNLSNKQQELELVKERHMVQIRTLLNKERSLAKVLKRGRRPCSPSRKKSSTFLTSSTWTSTP